MKMMLRVHLRLSNSEQGSILSLILGLLPSEVFAPLFFMQIIGISAKKTAQGQSPVLIIEEVG
jgi:hypothetical protein